MCVCICVYVRVKGTVMAQYGLLYWHKFYSLTFPVKLLVSKETAFQKFLVITYRFVYEGCREQCKKTNKNIS